MDVAVATHIWDSLELMDIWKSPASLARQEITSISLLRPNPGLDRL